MKKYFSLFTVLVMVFTLNIGQAEAVTSLDLSTGATVNSNVGVGERKTEANTSLQLKTEMKTDAKAELKDAVAGIKAEAKLKIEALQAKVKLLKDTNMKAKEEMRWNGRWNALNGFERVLMNVEKTEMKVNALIARVKTSLPGTNVSGAETLSASAKTDIASAKAEIAATYTLMAGIPAGTDLTVAQKATLKASAEKVQMLIKKARASLGEAMVIVRAEIQKAKQATATSVNTSTSTTTTTN
ncbi:MAG: hypothetical protein M3Q34_04630 [bacterium]|nr:hypothetical protein [bacterium]